MIHWVKVVGFLIWVLALKKQEDKYLKYAGKFGFGSEL